MLLNFFYLYLSQNLIIIFYFSMFLFLSSWIGIASSETFLEGIFFLEILYLALVFFSSLISIVTNHPIVDLVLIFIIFFTVCDSILGLILTLVTFKTLKTIEMKIFSFLTN